MYYIRASASQEVVRVMLSSVQRVKTNFDKKKETNLVVEEMTLGAALKTSSMENLVELLSRFQLKYFL